MTARYSQIGEPVRLDEIQLKRNLWWNSLLDHALSGWTLNERHYNYY